MPRRVAVPSLMSMCIANICMNMKSFWYEKYWKDIYSSPERVLTEVGPFEYLPGSIVNEIIEKLFCDVTFGDKIMSSLITSTLAKLSFPMNFARGTTTFDLISLRCQDTLKELTLSRYRGNNKLLKKVFKSLLKLQVLNLKEADIDDGVLAVVGLNCSALRKLSVKSCRKITDVSMEYLFVNKSTEYGLNSYGKCKMIESLKIEGTRISEIGVETVLRNAPKLQYLDYHNVCLVLGRMHGKDLESNNPLVQYSLTTLHAADYYRRCGLEKSLAKSLSVAIRVCPQLTDVYVYIDSENKERDVLRPLCQLKNLKNLDLQYYDGRRKDIFFKLVRVLSVSCKSITRLHLKQLPSADVSIIGVCCPLLEDFHLRISYDYAVVPSREETLIPTANNTRPFAFLKFLHLSMTFSNYEMRDNDIRPSEWKDLLSSRLLESLSINGSSSLTDRLLSEVLKDGQEFPNLRKIVLFYCPNITTGFVKLFLHLPNPLIAIDVRHCKNIHKSAYYSLKSFCKLNHLDVNICIRSERRIDRFSDPESDEDDLSFSSSDGGSDEEDFFLY